MIAYLMNKGNCSLMYKDGMFIHYGYMMYMYNDGMIP